MGVFTWRRQPGGKEASWKSGFTGLFLDQDFVAEAEEAMVEEEEEEEDEEEEEEVE